jgi:hypothetical protein
MVLIKAEYGFRPFCQMGDRIISWHDQSRTASQDSEDHEFLFQEKDLLGGKSCSMSLIYSLSFWIRATAWAGGPL